MEDLNKILYGCKKRDPQSQKALYECFYHFALKIVFRYVYNPDEAAEVTNDGFVKFFRTIDRFQVRDRANVEKIVGGLLKKIMVNTAIDLLRKKMLLPEIGSIPEAVWDIRDGQPDGEQLLLYKELMEIVRKLPPSYRIVFNMHIIDGYTHAEIADKLQIPIGTSKSNLLRAKAQILKLINQVDEVKQCSI